MLEEHGYPATTHFFSPTDLSIPIELLNPNANSCKSPESVHRNTELITSVFSTYHIYGEISSSSSSIGHHYWTAFLRACSFRTRIWPCKVVTHTHTHTRMDGPDGRTELLVTYIPASPTGRRRVIILINKIFNMRSKKLANSLIHRMRLEAKK